METKQYTRFWEELSHTMKVALVHVRASLVANAEFAGKFDFGPVRSEENGDNYFVGFAVSRVTGKKKNDLVAMVEFTLVDEEGGLNVKLAVDDVPEQTTAVSYIPYNYTEEVLTLDIEELQLRVDDAPLSTIIEGVEVLMRSKLSAAGT